MKRVNKEGHRIDFDDCIDLIKTPKIIDFVVSALSNTCDEFWNVPSSESIINQPPENKETGGIIIHSRKMVQAGISFCRPNRIKDPLSVDKVIATSILHDTYKNGDPWGPRADLNGHANIAVEKFRDLTVNGQTATYDPDLSDILSLIRDHIGNFNDPSTPAFKIGVAPNSLDFLHEIIQYADYISSRAWCSFTADEIIIER